MSKKSLVIITVLIAVIAGGFLIWRIQSTRANAAKLESEILKELTVSEINLILYNDSQGGKSEITQIAETPESRQAFLKAMREYLALAAQARREGLAEETSFKINFEYKKNLLLADLYRTKLSVGKEKSYAVAKEVLEEVWKNAENEKQFNNDMDALRSIQMAVAKERGDESTFPKLQGGGLIKAKENWANTKILSDMAKTDQEFMAQPQIGLRFKILEAGILSADYLRKNWSQKIKATEQEVAGYLVAHPEYDVKLKFQKAQALLKRVQAGEDFAKLAAENSEDRSTKANGGLFENAEKGVLWEEVENAALALENGRIADHIIETNTGYHVIKLENKQTKKAADGSEIVTYSVRHILLQKAFENPSHTNPEIPSPFITAEEVAKSQIEIEKRNKFVDNIIQMNDIKLPEDFALKTNDTSANLPESKK